MKKYENIICDVLVLEDEDIVTASDGIVLPGESVDDLSLSNGL